MQSAEGLSCLCAPNAWPKEIQTFAQEVSHVFDHVLADGNLTSKAKATKKSVKDKSQRQEL